MDELKREFKGNLGLFLVCAELTKRNLLILEEICKQRGLPGF
jgi:hypothetical protein